MTISTGVKINFQNQNTGDFSASANVFLCRKCSIYQLYSLDMTDLPFGRNPLDKSKNNYIQTCQALNHWNINMSKKL